MNVNDVEKIARDLTNQAVSVSHQYGPQAWAIICGVKRVDSLGSLLCGFVLLLCAGVGVKLLMIVHTNWEKWNWDDAAVMILTVFGGAGILCLIGAGLTPFTDVWNWVGVFDPSLAVAHDVIQKALAH